MIHLWGGVCVFMYLSLCCCLFRLAGFKLLFLVESNDSRKSGKVDFWFRVHAREKFRRRLSLTCELTVQATFKHLFCLCFMLLCVSHTRNWVTVSVSHMGRYNKLWRKKNRANSHSLHMHGQWSWYTSKNTFNYSLIASINFF